MEVFTNISRRYRARGGGAAGEGASVPPPPHIFKKLKKVTEKEWFQPPHFESLVSPPL